MSPPTVDSDAEVVHRSWNRPAEFAVLFDRHAVTIHRYVARRAGTTAADDLVSETFLAAFEARHRYDIAADSARPWLYGIASRLLRRHARQQERQWRAYARQSTSEHCEGHEERIVQRVDAAAAAGQLATALSALGEVDRDVLLLHAWGDLGYAQIASALDLPIGTVRSKLHRTRHRLRLALDIPDPALTHEETRNG